MAHNLNFQNGEAAMFYTGETPWHRLGTRLERPANAAEAISAAKLDFQVVKFPVVACCETSRIPVPGKFATVRMDTQEALGVVGKDYVPIQNAQCFGFLDALAGDGKVEYHTAGALGLGERIWLLAKLPGAIHVGSGGDDVVERFICLMNSHDGSSLLKAFWTPIRVVCQNTLNAALRGVASQETVTVMHRGQVETQVREAQRILGLAVHYYDDLAGVIDGLANKHIVHRQWAEYVQEVLPGRDDGSLPPGVGKARTAVCEIMENDRQRLPGVAGTAWAAYNAVAEYADHHKDADRNANRADRDTLALKSMLWGAGARLKARAWNAAVALVN